MRDDARSARASTKGGLIGNTGSVSGALGSVTGALGIDDPTAVALGYL